MTKLRAQQMMLVACSLLIELIVGRQATATTYSETSWEGVFAGADAIFIGEAQGHQARWANAQHTGIKTDYTFSVEEAVVPNGDIQTGHHVTVTFPGGQIGRLADDVAGLELPSDNRRYVVMVSRDPRRIGFAWCSINLRLLRIEYDSTHKTEIVKDYTGSPLWFSQEGRLIGSGRDRGAPTWQIATLDGFIQWLRRNIDNLKSKRPALPTDKPEPGDITIPRKRPYPISPSLSLGTGGDPTDRLFSILFVRELWAPAPVVISPLPPSTSFASYDANQIAKWNHYTRGVFALDPYDVDHFGYQNDRFEIVGTLNSDELDAFYGITWEEITANEGGHSVLAVTRRWVDRVSQKILDADIIFNPEFRFTLDDEAIYDGRATHQSFRQTVLHEVGHMFGLGHEAGSLSTMNYSPHPYRAICFPYADDAEAVRFAYYERPLTDLGVYMFHYGGGGLWGQTWGDVDVTPSRPVRPGEQISVSGYELENVGTNLVQEPTVYWWLSQVRVADQTPKYYLGKTTYPALPRFSAFSQNLLSRTLTIPAGVPGGYYYLVASVDDESAPGEPLFPFGNNVSWSRQQIVAIRR